MLAILQKEFVSFFYSAAAYVIWSVFLVAAGLFIWILPDTSVLESGYASLEIFFEISPYLFLFLIPAITMNTFSEEYKSGTIELLYTRPLTDWQIIVGKFLGCWLVSCIAILPTFIYYSIVWKLGLPPGNIDTASTIGSYIGLFLLSAAFTSTGVFASSITHNQIVAFILSFSLCYTLYDGFSALASLDKWSNYSYYIQQLGIHYHYKSLARGLIDASDVVYLGSVVIFFLCFTRLILQRRKW
ncbi:MAG: gliding motility-associated ABC transporter permease subunit GldF [Cytophagales bacterium]|nr:gliding motility-associated ABC transporter permease subunit GldF [Cytophagales bacterium]MDW8383547.1 gliding motility-associated ABC transporter permease subunit GldF [Flammeovirgaceae bacterium]